MKPLYINGPAATSVSLEDPAIVVRQPGQADRLYPIERLGRVASHINIKWQSEALLALAVAEVPVLFYDCNGQIIARLMGVTGERSALPARLLELLCRHDGQERYRDWCSHWERQCLLELQKRHEWLAIPAQINLMDRNLYKRVAKILARDSLHLGLQYLRACVHGWVTEYLHHLGIGAQTPSLIGGIIDLPTDLTRILQWQVTVHWANSLHDMPAATHVWATEATRNRLLVEHHQKLEPLLSIKGRQLTRRLHAWVIEME